MQQLGAAVTLLLQRSLYNTGAQLWPRQHCSSFGRIEQLAIKKRNNMVNIIELQSMGQQGNKKIYLLIPTTQTLWQSRSMRLFIECWDCHMSYKETNVMYQLEWGIEDWLKVSFLITWGLGRCWWFLTEDLEDGVIFDTIDHVGKWSGRHTESLMRV